MRNLKELITANESFKKNLSSKNHSYRLKEKSFKFMTRFSTKIRWFLMIALVVMFFLNNSKKLAVLYFNSCFYNHTKLSCNTTPVVEISNSIDRYFVTNTNEYFITKTTDNQEDFRFKFTLDSNSSIKRQNSHAIFSKEANTFKGILDIVYRNLDIINKKCYSHPKKLLGFLNASFILKRANLKDLVQFYDTSTSYIWLDFEDKASSDGFKLDTVNDNFTFVNKKRKKKTNVIKNVNRQYWQLWNSNNMSLLNITNNNFGEDGSRIQLGKF